MTQKDALDVMKMGHSVFLTGPAGSGKTHVLNEYIEYLRKKGVGVGITASTGIAATHLGGMTIHSWSGIGIRDEFTDEDIEQLLKQSRLKRRFEAVDVLVIDEVSMLHAHQLDLIDEITRAMKDSSQSFGGFQIILCGDFFQLPPVRRGRESSSFVYSAESWSVLDPDILYLDEQHRQTDKTLTALLCDIRNAQTSEDTLETLRLCYKRKMDTTIVPTKLYTHNVDVDAVNERALEALDGDTREFGMESVGPKKFVLSLKKSCLAPETLYLKEGASVMCVKNNFEKGYVNGTLGTVIDFEDDMPVIETREGDEITLSPESWCIEEDGKTLAEITQIPLRLAWAITVHKSQGMSLDAAEMDLSKSFEKGMGYVALSRVRTLDGLRLVGGGLNTVALQVNDSVSDFDVVLREKSDDVAERVCELGSDEVSARQEQFLKQCASLLLPKQKEKKVSTYEITKQYILDSQSIEDIAVQREVTNDTILNHIEKLLEQDGELDVEYLRPKKSKRVKRIEEVFERIGIDRLAPVKSDLGDDTSYHELRLVRIFMKRDAEH